VLGGGLCLLPMRGKEEEILKGLEDNCQFLEEEEKNCKTVLPAASWKRECGNSPHQKKREKGERTRPCAACLEHALKKNKRGSEGMLFIGRD